MTLLQPADEKPEAAQQEQQRPPATCAAPQREETICPVCAATMRLWAGFYRCGSCGFKESCCF